MVSSETIEVQCICRILYGINGMQFIQENAITEDFFPTRSREFKFILDHCKTAGCAPTVLTFQSAFPDFPLIGSSNVQLEPDTYLIKALIDNKNTEIVLDSLNRARDLISMDDYAGVLQLMNEASEAVLASSGMVAKDILTDTASRYMSFEERLKNKTKFFCKTGFNELDNVTGGWDRENEYAVIAARPGVGKSWVLMVSAEMAVRQGLRTGIFSGEMDYETVCYRFDAISSHLSNWKMAHGGSDIKDEYKLYLDTLPKKYHSESAKTPGLFVLTPEVAGGPVGVSTLKAFIKRYDLDILFVDQQSLLVDDKKAKSAWEQAANKSMDIKMLQVTEHIPIITVSQMNRTKEEDENGKRKNSTAQIAMSDRISQDASTIIVVGSEKDKEKPEAKLLCLELLKTRSSGGTGQKFKYIADFDRGIFQYMPDSESGRTDDKEQQAALYQEYIGGTNDIESFF